MDRFLTNYPNLKDVYENTTIQNVARVLILLIVIVGIFALSNGTIREDYLEGRGFYNSQNITAMDHYFCPNCNTIVPGLSNYYGAGGLGRNGGMGLGPGGNLICPGCGYLMPHQTGVPSYTVQCPKCGTTMARQIAANSSTAFNQYNRNGNNPGFQSGAASAATTPPITSDAVMTHVYRGVCSKCHQIIDNPR